MNGLSILYSAGLLQMIAKKAQSKLKKSRSSDGKK